MNNSIEKASQELHDSSEEHLRHVVEDAFHQLRLLAGGAAGTYKHPAGGEKRAEADEPEAPAVEVVGHLQLGFREPQLF